METLIKLLPADVLLTLMPLILMKLGNWLKGKDKDETGADDAFGNVLIAAAPAVMAFEAGNETAVKKALKTVYLILGNYLGEARPPLQP